VTTSTNGVTVTGSAQSNATTLLGANPANFPYGAPIYGVAS
jgi:hypothetical protein